MFWNFETHTEKKVRIFSLKFLKWYVKFLIKRLKLYGTSATVDVYIYFVDRLGTFPKRLTIWPSTQVELIVDGFWISKRLKNLSSSAGGNICQVLLTNNSFMLYIKMHNFGIRI